jgi:hypothetical protein
MTKLFITEFANMQSAESLQGSPQAALLPTLGTQVINLGGASVQSTPMQARTRLVRVHAQAACHVIAGENPTATTSSMRLAEGQTEYFGITPGQRLAVIQG